MQWRYLSVILHLWPSKRFLDLRADTHFWKAFVIYPLLPYNLNWSYLGSECPTNCQSCYEYAGLWLRCDPSCVPGSAFSPGDHICLGKATAETKRSCWWTFHHWLQQSCNFESVRTSGPLFAKKTPSYQYRDSIINLRRSSDRLRFIMGIPIPVRRRLLSE